MKPGRKYRIARYADEIEAVQLYKVTDKTYGFTNETGRVYVVRKVNTPILHETWQDARAALIKRIATHIEAALHEASVLKKVALKVTKMKDPS